LKEREIKNFTANIITGGYEKKKGRRIIEKYRYKSLTGAAQRALRATNRHTRWREELLTHLKQKENGTVIRRHILRAGDRVITAR